jgi:chemotaxis protein CheX
MPNPSPFQRPSARQPVAPPSKPPAVSPQSELRDRFNLPQQPAGVQKIAGLVGAKDKSLQEITRIIDADHRMTQRLIITAYPKVSAREGATVSNATSRLGIARVISIIVGEMLADSVADTFETMASIRLEPSDVANMPRFEKGVLVGSVRFRGTAEGEVALAFSQGLAQMVVARQTGGNLDDQYPSDVIHDAIGEVVNVITGNLQSRLCDAGLPAEVELPQVAFKSTFASVTILGGSSDRFLFHQGTHYLGVNLCIAPFAAKK